MILPVLHGVGIAAELSSAGCFSLLFLYNAMLSSAVTAPPKALTLLGKFNEKSEKKHYSVHN